MFQEFIEILILSAVQGISEFLPISSSAHLILVSNFYDLKTGSLLIDISLHLGSLFAIIFYFRKDLLDLKNNKNISSNLSLKSIIIIGLFQILALIPGVSRAGITMTAARFMKFNRVDSGKISFLLSIPALTGASLLGLRDIFYQSIEINYVVITAVIFSFLFSYITVKFFLNYLNRFSLNIFVFYRIIISLVLFAIIYF